jgi:hypothetical protein
MSQPHSSPADKAHSAMPGRVVTATFPSRAAADRASDELVRMGISPENVRVVEDAPNPASVTAEGDTGWDAILDSQPQDEVAQQRAKGIAEGAFVVGAEIDASRLDAVMKLFGELGGLKITSSKRR